MNFHKLIIRNPLILFILVGFILINIINIKYWWATVLSSTMTIFLLIDKYPRIGNHSTIILFVSMIVVLLFLLKLFNYKIKINTYFLSYFFRITVVTIYFYTGFHKLNDDFFNSCVSCVNGINEYNFSNFLIFKIPYSNQWSSFFQYITVFIEMILPFGLLHHKTRKFTALFLLFFHLYLSFSGFADFGALALFLLVGCLHDFESLSTSNRNLKGLKLYLLFIILAIMSRYFMLLSTIDKHKIDFFQGVIFNFGFLIFTISYFNNYTIRKYNYNRNYNFKLIAVFILISIWTLKTYIGLGNAGNLTMFSNLVTEKSRSNHLLIDTKRTKLFNFEEDYVHIIKLDNPNIREDFEGYLVPRVEFNFLVNYWDKKYKRSVPCKLIYKNQLMEIKDLRKSEFNQTKWWYKYLFFRKIQIDGANNCRW